MRHIEGYEAPIHRSLTTPMLIMGVPRSFAMVNGTFLAAVTLGFQTFYAIPVCIILHLIALYFAKKDDQFFEVHKRMIWQKTFYRV